LKRKIKIVSKTPCPQIHAHIYIGGRILGQIILTTRPNFELQEPLP